MSLYSLLNTFLVLQLENRATVRLLVVVVIVVLLFQILIFSVKIIFLKKPQIK